jgi:hypothetical protein
MLIVFGPPMAAIREQGHSVSLCPKRWVVPFVKSTDAVTQRAGEPLNIRGQPVASDRAVNIWLWSRA